jgi:hypothetical protein
MTIRYTLTFSLNKKRTEFISGEECLVICEGCGKKIIAKRSKKLRQLFESLGWQTRNADEKDFCPDCWSKLKGAAE